MTAEELREKFIKFFEEKGHKVLPSASLVPSETDPSVLFTTAGMQQFKRYYSEPSEAPAPKIVTVQKCIRTGDIDEVGDTTHLTFFEMLGNFSFDDYFKKEAIELGWEFLTEKLNIQKSRIHATYFKGEKDVPEDTESKKILEGIDGLGKVIAQGFDDNFWSLGTENSPGGPTVEFYVDGLEVWNLVFNEYIFKEGKYTLSGKHGVDTGMGLERLTAVMNGLDDVYKTDLFAPIIKGIEQLHPDKYVYGDKTDGEYIEEGKQCWVDTRKQFRIVADHIKAAVFCIADGAEPSNKGRGYIARRLIRRAIVKANQLGIEKDFTANLAKEVFEIYDGVYYSSNESEKSDSSRQVSNNKKIVLELEKEEQKFRRTLSSGLSEFEKWYSWESKRDVKLIPGSVMFDLFQSHGFPLELTIEIAKDKGLEVSDENIEQYNNLAQQHQELSRTASAGMFKGGLADSGEETKKLHTAAHLLLAALRKVLGEGVFQKGSNITAERLRFDFSYPEKMTLEQINEVENIVNEQIEKDLPVVREEMTLEEAKKSGAMGVFESKYGEKVKVYSISPSTPDGSDNSSTPSGRSEPPFSREICGGPHASRTGELGHFKISKEESSSAGVRRIKAVLE